LTPLKMLLLRARHLEHLRQHLPLVYSTVFQAIQASLNPTPPPAPTVNDRQHRAFCAEDQLKLVELLANPGKLTQQKRGYSRQQSSIEEVIEWLAEDMDELISTERSGLLTGEVYNPNCPAAILSANSKDQYRAMKAALLEADRIDEQDKDDEESNEKDQDQEQDQDEDQDEERDLVQKTEEEKRQHEDMTSKMAKLRQSAKKHYAKIQINLHPRRPGVEGKYRVRSLQNSPSPMNSKPSNEVNLGPRSSPLISSPPPDTDTASPAPLEAEQSFHFDASSDSS
jgi:myosin heavy subunit